MSKKNTAATKSKSKPADVAKVTQKKAVTEAIKAVGKDKHLVVEFVRKEFGMELTPTQAGVAVYQIGMLARRAKGQKLVAKMDPAELKQEIASLKEEAKTLGFKLVKRTTWGL